MNRAIRYVSSSIGAKQIMSLTGLALVGFLCGHLAGNFFIFKGPSALNQYAHTLLSNPFILPIEMGLAGLFLIHIGFGIYVTLHNWTCRPVGYAVDASAGGQTWMSRTMIWSGLLILCFLFIHVYFFKFSPLGKELIPDWGIYNFGKFVIDSFKGFLTAAFYIAAVAVPAFHVSHGLKSALQTLGLNRKLFDTGLTWVSYLGAAALFLGFSSIPVLIFLSF